MQYNYDFHLHHWLVDASQMLGEFESFHYNRNVHNVSWYGKLNFPPAPHLIWEIEYQIPGKEFFQKVSWGKQEILVSLLLFLNKYQTKKGIMNEWICFSYFS